MWYRSLTLLVAIVAFSVGCQAPPGVEPSPQAAAGPTPESPALHAGAPAPLFTLKTLDGTDQVDLARFTGDRPVLLFFGSYT